jgi:hypothetical protein
VSFRRWPCGIYYHRKGSSSGAYFKDPNTLRPYAFFELETADLKVERKVPRFPTC